MITLRAEGRMMLRTTTRLGLLSFALVVAACRPPTIVRDPVYPPVNPTAPATQPPPVAPVIGDPALLPLPVLQADFVGQSGSDTVRFDRDSHVLSDEAQAVLTRQAAWLRARPAVRAKIEGHADTRQSREYALALGERRAAAVRNYLVALGVSPEQLTVVSWGKDRPATAAAHEAAWLQNSRVVTVLTR